MRSSMRWPSVVRPCLKSVRLSHNIAFLGSDQFSCLVLDGLLTRSPHLEAKTHVVTPAPSKTGRGLKTLKPTLLHSYATHPNRTLPFTLIHSKTDLSTSLPALFTSLRTSMLITASFGFLLPSNLIDSVPSNHALNVHPSLLPDYRGAAPVQWAIAHGDTHSGVTVQSLSKGKFDHGSILAQKPLDIPPNAAFHQVLPAFANLGAEALSDVIEHLDERIQHARDQESDGGPRRRAPKISKDDAGVANWGEADATQLERWSRGWSHQIPLWTHIDDKRVQLLNVRLASDAHLHLQPGQMGFDKRDKVLVLRCGQGALGVGQVKPDGSKVLSAAEYWNGHKSRARS